MAYKTIGNHFINLNNNNNNNKIPNLKQIWAELKDYLLFQSDKGLTAFVIIGYN